MMLIEADAPAWSDGLRPSSVTVTGNVATPELIVAIAEICVTRPVTASVEPAARMRARCPLAISPTCASLTVPVTWKAPGVSSTIACVALEDDELLLPPPDDEE